MKLVLTVDHYRRLWFVMAFALCTLSGSCGEDCSNAITTACMAGHFQMVPYSIVAGGGTVYDYSGTLDLNSNGMWGDVVNFCDRNGQASCSPSTATHSGAWTIVDAEHISLGPDYVPYRASHDRIVCECGRVTITWLRR